MTINRVQGTVVRVEDCTKGGQHVLTRARQLYCERCRPAESREALERQRRRRARLKASPAAIASVAEIAPSTVKAVQTDSLASIQQALTEHRDIIEQLKAEAKTKINAMAVSGKPARGLLERYADLVALHQLLENGVAWAAHLNRPPALRGVGAPRPS